jgi:hypothetical protein
VGKSLRSTAGAAPDEQTRTTVKSRDRHVLSAPGRLLSLVGATVNGQTWSVDRSCCPQPAARCPLPPATCHLQAAMDPMTLLSQNLESGLAAHGPDDAPSRLSYSCPLPTAHCPSGIYHRIVSSRPETLPQNGRVQSPDSRLQTR